MKFRMSRCAALIGTVLSLNGFAQECQEVSLYKNGSEVGQMVDGSRTFPESPEWAANWGNMDGMEAPYIRLSGQKNTKGDWMGELSFAKAPFAVGGGSLKMKIRSTQKGNALIWLAGDFGQSSKYPMAIEANKTYQISVPMTDLVGGGKASVSRVGIGLKDVPVYQYTTLFIDDIAFSCEGAIGNANSNSSVANGGNSNDFASVLEELAAYSFSEINPASPVREKKFSKGSVNATSAAYDDSQRRILQDSTTLDFVVSILENVQIENFATATSLTPAQSRKGWYNSLYLLERNRLRDSVIANPKMLYYEAEIFASNHDNKEAPLLIGNVDYGYRTCGDSVCDVQPIESARLLLAGLPMAQIRGSVLKLHYDPYFVTTNRKNLPQVEIYLDKAWVKFSPKSSLKIKFPGAGTQKIKVRLTEGGVTTNQTLFVEVK